MKKKWLLPLVLVGLALAGCDQLPQVQGMAAPTSTPPVPLVQSASGVIAEGNIAPRDSAWMMSRSGGQVAEVLVQEGDEVEKDAVLLRFGDHEGKAAALSAAKLEQSSAQQALDDLTNKAAVATSAAKAALRQAEKALVTAQQQLADLDTTEYQDDLDSLQKDAGTFKVELDDAQKEFDKVKDMDVANSQRKTALDKLDAAQKKYDDAVRKRDLKINDLDQARAAVDAAQAQLDEAQRVFDLRKDGPDPDLLSLAQARLDNANAQAAAAQTAIDDMTLRAPFAGTVVKLNVSEGEAVMPNMQILLIADFSELYVETNDLTEMEVVRVGKGQAATGVPDSIKDLSIPLTVERIDQVAGRKGGDVTYTVRLKIDEPDPRLRWGMTVEVRFEE